MRRRLASSALVAAAVCAGSLPSASKPLDPEICANLKQQRDALQGNGLRELISKKPTSSVPPERLQQVRQLITLDGQLRFRCNMELLLPTLKPDPVDEFVDAGDTAGRPAPVSAAVRRAKAAKAAPPAASGAPAATDPKGTPAQPRARAAAVRTGGTNTAQPELAKPVAKAQPKTEDAYRPPASGDTNGTPLNKQQPKSP